ncbi:hypothetical protein NUV25_33700 [Burkholderia pseudomultivorans]|uniref:hypothetical protein n=1 Tax=Burkholderia TaxID=32008 RepID=UPI000F5988A0|nr:MULTISPECIES: hypothetical protein [Burkholderia]MDS0862662.1 hypothetical protein [Burkholderia pseudomultivorans]
MADSEHLKDLKSVWGNSCQSMWAELLALSIAESHVISNYAQIPSERLLTDMFYVPKLDGRLRDLRRDTFLERVTVYKQSVITNRLVVLSASFEIYLSNFIDAFAKKKPKFWDPIASEYTADGNKFIGTVRQTRGLDQKILKFGELAPSKIKSIGPHLPFLVDVYMLRNVLAHRAGLVDAGAAGVFKHVKIAAGERVTITTEQLLELAAPVIKIAEALDKKL